MQNLKKTAFALLGLIIAVLVTASVIDAILGTDGIGNRIYSSTAFVLLWAIAVVAATVYVVKCHLWRMPATALIHGAFVLILVGALTTHIFGKQGRVHLREGERAASFVTTDGEDANLPFVLELEKLDISYYLSTSTPQDFRSNLIVRDGDRTTKASVSMNKILRYRYYRFYQSGCDPDGLGTTLSVSHDPWGIGLSYSGYLLLLLGFLTFFVQKDSGFRKLLRAKSFVAVLVILLVPASTFAAAPVPLVSAPAAAPAAANAPKITPRSVSEEMGTLMISYNGRVCPLQTFANDFTVKLYGKSRYRGRDAEEILCGWMFFPDSWKPEPMIKVKGKRLKAALGVEGKYVALTDFANRQSEYKLAGTLGRIRGGEDLPGKKDFLAADEKIGIINSVFTGSAIKIFPLRDGQGNVTWYSADDKLPDDLDLEKWVFIRKSLDIISENVVMKDYAAAKEMIRQIREFQIAECGGALPSPGKVKAERLYNRIYSAKPWAMGSVTLGLLAFFYFILCSARELKPRKGIVIFLNVVMSLVLAYLTLAICLRGVVSGHIPMSNGFETMQMIAWSAFFFALAFQKRFEFALPAGLVTGGLSLLVAMMGQSNPAVTSLTPVLNSPLLSLHVMVIMISYVLLAFIMLNGLTALILKAKGGLAAERQISKLARTSVLMLYPAEFLLTAGIFIGAVWANISWGRYWGWDPKEVWALITMLVYSFPLHRKSLKWFRDPLHLHIYFVLAFLCVLMTYFGVNYFLPGLHSYA